MCTGGVLLVVDPGDLLARWPLLLARPGPERVRPVTSWWAAWTAAGWGRG